MAERTSVMETRIIHSLHRTSTTMLAEAAHWPAADPAAVGELRTFLVRGLRHHHESEDRRLWPLIEGIAPETAAPLAELAEEHEAINHAIDALEAAPVGSPELATAADTVRDLVHRHVDHEDPVLLPVLRTQVSADAWNQFAGYVRATNPPDALHLAIGFLDRVATPAEEERLVGSLPEPVQALVPLFRRRAEKTFAALGAG